MWLTSVMLDYSSSGHERQESRLANLYACLTSAHTHVGNWSNAGDYMDSQILSYNVGSDDLFVSLEHGL